MAATAGSESSLDADPSSLFNSQPSHAYSDKIEKVVTLLNAKFGVEPVVFNYKRQRADNPTNKGAWGKAAVSLIPRFLHHVMTEDWMPKRSIIPNTAHQCF